MKNCKRIGLSVVTGLMMLAMSASADVFQDVLALYCGATDHNNNGTFDPGEVIDARRAGLPNATTHGLASSKAGTEPGTVAYVANDVGCAVAGVELKNQVCYDFTLGNYSWKVPISITDANYTAIVRFRENEVQLDKDGNVVTTDTRVCLVNMAYSGKGGLYIGVHCGSHEIGGYCGSSSGSGQSFRSGLFVTNDTYQARGACWNEMAIVVKPSTTSGQTTVTIYLYQPGLEVKSWSKSYTTSYIKPISGNSFRFGGQWATAETQNKQFYFQGKVHMLAYWNRPLSKSEIEEAFRTVPVSDARRPAVWRIGNDDYGHETFGGTGSSAYTIDPYAQTDAGFPSKLVAGDGVTIPFTALARDSGMKQVFRIAAASQSGAGKVAVSMDGVSIGSVDVVPGEGRNILLPAALTEGNHTMTFVVSEADDAGVRLDCVELSGSWRLGEKNSEKPQDFGNLMDTENDFYVSNAKLTDLRGLLGYYTSTSSGAVSRDKRVYRIHFNVPADMAGKYKLEYRSSIYSYGGTPQMPLILNVNGNKKWEGLRPTERNEDMVFRFKPEELVTGDNVLEWTTSWTGNDPTQWPGWKDGEHWQRWDYHQLSVLGEPQGLMLLFR